MNELPAEFQRFILLFSVISCTFFREGLTKELHGLRYARMLGIRNMYEQSFLTAAVQNMKRIAKAFRFPFSLLSLCIRGCFLPETAPLSAVCGSLSTACYPCNRPIRRNRAASQAGPLIQRRLATLIDPDEINILCINCIYPSVIHALEPFFMDKGRHVRMHHNIQPDIGGLNATEFVVCISPILFDPRYSPYLLASWVDTGQYPSVNGDLLPLSARFGKRTEEQLYVISDSRSAYELPNADSVGIFAFYSRIIAELPFRPTPLKMLEQTPTDYPSLVRSCLSHKLNRSTFAYGTDISFMQVPTDIALASFQDKSLFPPEVASSLLKQLISLHERRFQNLYTKKKPAITALSPDGCRRFLESGKSRDHFTGIRSFLPKERLITFSTMLKYADINRNFSPIVLKDQGFLGKYLTVGYDRLGVALIEYDTGYDSDAGYDYVFLS